MHVGLDLLFLVPGESGGRETYVRELLPALAAARPDVRLTAFLNRETAAAAPAWLAAVDRAVVLRRVSARGRASWALGELAGVARAAARAHVDVLHGTANFAPLTGPFARVLTLHDLLFRRRPELLPRVLRWGTEALVPPAARRADRVIAVSAAARADIVAELGVPAARVDVVPNGIATRPPGDGARGRARLDAGARPVVLSVATDLPHKNLPALLEGLARLEPSLRPLLALAGHGTDTGALPELSRALGVHDDVRTLGSVPADALEDLYAAATGLIAATRWEGFGLPILEAMARGVPVACSDLPVLREIAGDGVEWLDPEDPASIAAALRALTSEDPVLEARRGAGRARAAGYTWQAAAVATADVYERARASAGRAPRRPARASA